MKYFIDTEFIDDGHTIDLISIGIAAEDYREYYACNAECDLSKANDWVRKNVLIHLPPKFEGQPLNESISSLITRSETEKWKTRDRIASDILWFVHGCKGEPWYKTDKGLVDNAWYDEEVEFWGYYADYDWVVFCQLFGSMMDLPKGFPMYCRDLKQECDRLGNPELPKQETDEHIAIADARWARQVHRFLFPEPGD